VDGDFFAMLVDVSKGGTKETPVMMKGVRLCSELVSNRVVRGEAAGSRMSCVGCRLPSVLSRDPVARRGGREGKQVARYREENEVCRFDL
jgi:hypothetical protein